MLQIFYRTLLSFGRGRISLTGLEFANTMRYHNLSIIVSMEVLVEWFMQGKRRMEKMARENRKGLSFS